MGYYEFKEEDAFAFARHIRANVKPFGDELRFKGTCPYCNGGQHRDKDTFSINLKTGQFKCLRASCGIHGNMLQLSRDYDFSLGESVDEYYKPKKTYKRLATPKEPIKPKEEAVTYLESRGISKETAEKYEITVHAKNPDWLVFPFFDDKSQMQFIKYRDTKFFKGKTYTNKDGKVVKSSKEWTEAECKPILFGMKQCNDKFDRLIITEGQLDSLAVVESGIENAVSVPTGALGMTWVPYCYNWVSKFDEIVVFGDFEKGHITLLDDIQKRFSAKIMHVREEDYQGCKDANEILIKHGKDAVKKAVENAVYVPIDKIVRLADVQAVNIYELPKLKTGIADLDRDLCGGIPFGIVCLLTGKRGEGKSTLGSQILGQAVKQNFITFAYSGELPNYLYKSWFDFQIAGPHHIQENFLTGGYINRFITNKNQEIINAWYYDKAWLYDNRIVDDDEMESLLTIIIRFIQQYGAKVILLDNLMTAMYLDTTKGSDKYEQQGIFVHELTKIAIRYDVLIILVAHKRKNGFSTDTNDEVSGSGDITNLAGLTLSYGVDKDLAPSQRKLIIAKNRIFGKTNFNGITLNYDEKSKRIYGDSDDVNVSIGWEPDDNFMEINTNYEIPF